MPRADAGVLRGNRRSISRSRVREHPAREARAEPRLDDGFEVDRPGHALALDRRVREDRAENRSRSGAQAGARPPRRPLTVEEARLLLASVADQPIGPLVNTALATGMRQGELLAL